MVYFDCWKMLKGFKWVDVDEKISNEHIGLIQRVTGCSKSDIIVSKKKLLVKGGYGEDFYGYVAEDFRKGWNNPFLITGVITQSSLRNIDDYEVNVTNESFDGYDGMNESLASSSKISNLMDKYATITKSDRGTFGELELREFLKACGWGKIDLNNWKWSVYKPAIPNLNIKVCHRIFSRLQAEVVKWKAYKAGFSYPKKINEFLYECEKASAKIIKKYDLGTLDEGVEGINTDMYSDISLDVNEGVKNLTNAIIKKAIEDYRNKL